MSNNDRLVKKAESKYKEAKKLTTKSIFPPRFILDWNTAAPLFEEAAKCFRACENRNKEALKCMILGAEANFKADNKQLAGNGYRDAAKFLVDLKQYKESVKYFEKAHMTYYEDDKPDLAALMLITGAKALEKTGKNLEETKALFKRGLQVYEDSEKFHYGMDKYVDFNNFLVRNEMYQECIDSLIEQKKAFKSMKQPHNLWKANLAITVLCLKIGDLNLADKYNDEFSGKEKGYGKTDECVLANRIIDIFDDRDEESLTSIKKEPKFKYIQSSVARLVKKLSFKDIKGKRTKKKITINDDGEVDGEDDDDNDEEDEESNM